MSAALVYVIGMSIAYALAAIGMWLAWRSAWLALAYSLALVVAAGFVLSRLVG